MKMRLRYPIFYILITLLLLFYPGDSLFFHIFSYNKNLFLDTSSQKNITIHPVPYLSTTTAPAASAEGILIADLPSFTPIYTKNEKERLYPASTTKIITALVALDIYKPDDIITIKKVNSEGQIMGLFVGERITVENLLYGTLVHSANDAAYALADNYGFDEFIEKMNEKAKELHMSNSHFKNPAGLDDPDHYSTPLDLALASRKLLTIPYLKKMVSTKEIIISDVDFRVFHKLSNVNKLLGEIQGMGGLKTGYTESAGENLISFYKKNDHEYLVVLLKSQDRFADTRTILKWIDDNVSYTQ